MYYNTAYEYNKKTRLSITASTLLEWPQVLYRYLNVQRRRNRFSETPSVERDAFDSQAQGSGGNPGLCDFADLPAHQGGADRGLQRDLPSLEVHLVGADYLEFHAGICREVGEFYPAQKANPVFGEDVGIDYA